jgi:hypothetical protein
MTLWLHHALVTWWSLERSRYDGLDMSHCDTKLGELHWRARLACSNTRRCRRTGDEVHDARCDDSLAQDRAECGSPFAMMLASQITGRRKRYTSESLI